MTTTCGRLWPLVVLAVGLADAASLSAEKMTVGTQDGLSLKVSSSGELDRLSAGGRDLLPKDLAQFYLVDVCDVTKGDEFVPAKGKAVVEAGETAIVAEAELDRLSLRVAARYEAVGELVTVKLSVHDLSGKDRGLLVRFSLPIQADGWRWWDDLETGRIIGSSGIYEHSQRIREFAALPEWRDKPALNMGAHSVNYCNVITGPVGLCYAVPLDQPRIFRTGYDANTKRFYIVYDVALAKETDPPSMAECTFYLYLCDPDWGMRSALDKYYRRFPHFFTKHVKKDGMWMAFSKLSDIDNVNEFRFAYQEGAPEPAYDDNLGVDSLTYFTHAGLFANIPDYDPETDPEPSYERQLAAIREKFKQLTGSAEMFDTSGLFDGEGKLSIKRTAVYGHIIAQYNLDPSLPYGQHMLQRIPKVFQSYRTSRGGELDGFYYDGITTGINYRRDHFQHADYPPIWDPARRKPFLYNYFSSVEFAKEVARRLHDQGKITMMNGAMGSSFYTAPYLDVMGAETGLRINRRSFNYVRTICRHKPFVTLLKGNFSQLSKDDIALFMRRCVAYGVFPGFFDWPPSGLGPGSRYWDHAEWYERDRLTHRKYQTLCRQLAEAGWEPLTFARSRELDLAIERFGNADGNEVFFTVLNDSAHPVETVVTIPADCLPKDAVVVDEVAQRWLADATIKGDALEVPVSLGPESLAVLHVASKEQLASGQIAEVAENLTLRKNMTEMDKARPESLVHWRSGRYGGYQRDNVDGTSCFKLANQSDSQTKGATQWVMLYQDEPEPLKLKVRLKCDNVTPGTQGVFQIDTVLCHVNMKTRFTTRRTEKFDLDRGTYDWRETEFLIRPERPLRSIQLSVNLSRCSGTAWIDAISIAPVSEPDQEYVVDRKMEQWNERPSAEQLAQMDATFADLQEAIETLRDRPIEEVTDGCLSVLNQASACKQAIHNKKLANPFRRELRELEDMTARLSLICSTLMGVRGPYVDLPSTVAPGEAIVGRIRVEGVRNERIRYAFEMTPGWCCEATGEGTFSVQVPNEAVGTTARLVARAIVSSPSGQTLTLEDTAEIQVVPAMEATMRLSGVSASADEFHFAIDVANNSQTATEMSCRPHLPEGWRCQTPQTTWEVAAKSKKSIQLLITADAKTKPGRYEIRAELTSPKLPAPFKFSETVFFLPATLNLLKEPSFETPKVSRWAKGERGFQIDTSQAHSGRQSLKLDNRSSQDQSGASQTIVLNQNVPRPIVVRGHAKADNVSGHPSRTFSIYVDIYYTDGTPLYGQTVDWQTGTTGWQYGEMTIEPAKPIRNVNVYLLLRRHSGTAWFDDIFVAEEP